jgi:phage terminase Nu1 subunit (DNA packaging protein)
MNDEVTTADLCRLLGVSRETLSSLAKRGIVVRSGKRGAYALEASVSGYCKHLRDMASARGGEDAIAVRAKLASAQADLAAEKVKVMRAETCLRQRSRRCGPRSSAPSAIASSPSRAGSISQRAADSGLDARA